MDPKWARWFIRILSKNVTENWQSPRTIGLNRSLHSTQSKSVEDNGLEPMTSCMPCTDSGVNLGRMVNSRLSMNHTLHTYSTNCTSGVHISHDFLGVPCLSVPGTIPRWETVYRAVRVGLYWPS
jgi:hypothetical protein